MLWLYALDIVYRAWCLSQQKLPERTFASFSFDLVINIAIFCWALVLYYA
jgi:hypothetical protein